ncbi:MAG TPA: substrate-binding domain-containing protein [Gemmatimonadaceae bacterium]|nr:substrate-binding domain-containing protein [Gemmatimonadaceae bacterium]
MRIFRTLLPALALLVGAARVEAQSTGYVVVVHQSNPVSSIRRDELSKIFLKKITVWRTKLPVVAVDQSSETRIRAQFTRDVHHREVTSVESYWQQQIFAGRAVPPQQRPGDAEVMAFIANNPNAIGYVSAGAQLAPGLKVLSVE